MKNIKNISALLLLALTNATIFGMEDFAFSMGRLVATFADQQKLEMASFYAIYEAMGKELESFDLKYIKELIRADPACVKNSDGCTLYQSANND